MMTALRKRLFCVAATSLLALSPVAGQAQSNTLVIEQIGPTTGVGNTLTVDQARAADSRVGGLGLFLSSTSPLTLSSSLPGRGEGAIQSGSGNVATITMGGTGSEAVLYQTGRTPGTGFNSASMDVLGNDAIGALVQTGNRNLADLDLFASSSFGSITQIGDDNNANLAVSGRNSNGSIAQIGSGNQAGLTVSGINSTVIYTQIGNGLSTGGLPPLAATAAGISSAQGGIVVTTNAQAVAITQTRY